MSGGRNPELAAELFGPLTNDLRVRIIVTLAEHQSANPEDRALPFNELRARVGRPDSGVFNYHLKQLEGTFVWQSEDGYALTVAGERIVAAILAEAYSIEDERGPIELDAEDPLTGKRLAGEWRNGLLVVRGADDPVRDEGFLYREAVPPGIFTGRSFEDALDIAFKISNVRYSYFIEGVCPLCYAPADRTVKQVTSSGRSYHQFRGLCTKCGHLKRGPVAVCTLTHPAVISFFHDHGRTPLSEPYWELDFIYDHELVDVLSTEPLKLELRFDADEDRLATTIDGTGRVVDWSLSSASPDTD